MKKKRILVLLENFPDAEKLIQFLTPSYIVLKMNDKTELISSLLRGQIMAIITNEYWVSQNTEITDFLYNNQVSFYCIYLLQKKEDGHFFNYINKNFHCRVLLDPFKEDEILHLLEKIGKESDKIKDYQQLQEKFKDQSRILQDNSGYINQFLINLSHEIRTPLNAIMGFATLLPEKTDDTEKMKKYCTIINEAGNNLLKQIDNLLLASSIETGRFKPRLTLFDINELILMLHNHYSTRGTSGTIRFNATGLQGKNIKIISDKNIIQIILTQFLENAFKYTICGTIDMGYIKDSDEIHLFVRDTGPGLPDYLLKRKEFVQFCHFGFNMHGMHSGMGLGLAVAQKLAKIMGGSIWFESEKGNGTTFYFSIPWVKPGNANV